MSLRTLTLLLLLSLPALPAAALDVVEMQTDAGQRTLTGRILVTAKDGGLLVETPDGVMHAVQPNQLRSKQHNDEPFVPLPADKLGDSLLTVLPKGFSIYRTNHYVIAYDTSREYAQWCGSLLERLHSAFSNFWTKKGIKLTSGEFPLPVVIFSRQLDYTTFAADELGKNAGSIIGYYSMATNRVIMFDLTGLDALRDSRRGTTAEINHMLSQPAAERAVATVIHEATHQIAFNSGMQTRFADIPFWLSEGLAVYFEAPDLSSSKGWRGIGNVNRVRLDEFRQYSTHRPADSLRTLLTEDKRFRDPRAAPDAYAEAWALTYYLIQHNPKQYVQYLQTLTAKPQMVWDEPEERMADFRKAFAIDLEKLDGDLLRQMQKLK